MSSEPMDGFYDIHVGTEQRAADRTLQAQAAIANTHYTYVQRTNGFGYAVINVPFDVTFINEPVFMTGSALLGINYNGWMPISTAVLLRWLRDSRGGYVGAQVLLYVELRVARRFSFSSKLPPSVSVNYSVHAIPVVGHQLTFVGAARANIDATSSTQAQATGPIDVGVING